MRGKPCGRITEVSHERITPAGAGKTKGNSGHLRAEKDHPRRCGENAAARRQTRSKSGSPPQVRGKQLMLVQHAIIPRITPAGAGKTGRKPVLQGLCQDHPRRCGENLTAGGGSTKLTGSPPQVRGKLSIYDVIETINRITPAGAGKTATVDAGNNVPRDHPRRCGENAASKSAPAQPRGSPPQVRGKQPTDGHILRKHGITPAGAGKTKAKTP